MIWGSNPPLSAIFELASYNKGFSGFFISEIGQLYVKYMFKLAIAHYGATFISSLISRVARALALAVARFRLSV